MPNCPCILLITLCVCLALQDNAQSCTIFSIIVRVLSLDDLLSLVDESSSLIVFITVLVLDILLAALLRRSGGSSSLLALGGSLGLSWGVYQVWLDA